MQCRIGAPMLIIPGKKFDMKSQFTRGARSRIMYVELKSGFSDNGPARIGRVTFSKSGLSVFYRGLELHRLSGRGVCGGNYFDEATGNEYWVSGLKKNGQDRHHCGRGEVLVDKDIRAEYVAFIEGSSCTK